MEQPAPEIEIQIRAFALVRQALGVSELCLLLPAGVTVVQLLDTLKRDYPALVRLSDRVVVTVNQRYAGLDQTLEDGDQVAVFPPVSGGSPDDWVVLSATPIDIAVLNQWATEPGAGAVVTFAGVVRDNNLGRPVDFLEYEAYTEMAEAKLRQVIQEARAQWPRIRRMAVAHRIGHLEIGQTAALVVVGAPHRDDGAFEAARFAIDRIKEIVPIWKKEGWAGNEEWLEGDYLPRPGE